MNSQWRFACTRCGLCCNRPPEVELGEAAALADVFAWQVLLRLYSLPRQFADYLGNRSDREQAIAEFYQSKRLLAAFAAHSYHAKAKVDGKNQERTFYLTISALALDPQSGSCPALSEGACSIYDRRPLSCRSVPLHYSRADAFALADLDRFIATPGYRCASAEDAPLVIEDGAIRNMEITASRKAALDQAAADSAWKAAAIKAIRSGAPGWPSLRAIEQHAARGAVVMPMPLAWRAASDAGLLDQADFDRLIEQQIAVLDRLIAAGSIGALELRRSIAGS